MCKGNVRESAVVARKEHRTIHDKEQSSHKDVDCLRMGLLEQQPRDRGSTLASDLADGITSSHWYFWGLQGVGLFLPQPQCCTAACIYDKCALSQGQSIAGRWKPS